MGPVNVVREDPKQPGLLFAGTERTIYFSIDDGDRWHSHCARTCHPLRCAIW